MTGKISSSPAVVKTANTTPSRLGYVAALDGLRALAVLAVLFYHADVYWLAGGFLGVEVFFVVSGYLITSLLLAEYRADNSINLFCFWQRRARRLLPALFALLAAVMVYAVLFLPEEVVSLRADVLAAFAYVTNWYLIAGQQSYFEAMGRPSLLRHLWSLAVEEQFYLLWPLVFAFLLTRLKSRSAMLLLMFGATVSALWMGTLFQPDTDPSRIYYGTDTRAAGLLIGAALAFVVKGHREGRFSVARRWLLDLVGIAALGALAAAALFLGEFDPFLYQGGMLLVSAGTALVIAAAVAPKSPLLGPVLGFGLLRWIGLRSYSLYLWHWPVFMVTRPQLDTTLEGAPLLALRFALTFALAEFSYRIVETPIRRGALGKTWNSWTNTHGARRWVSGAAGMILFAALTFGAVILGGAIAQAQPPQEPELVLMTPEEESVSASQEFTVVPLPLDSESVASAELSTEGIPSDGVTSQDLLAVSFVIPDQADPPAMNFAETASVVQDNWLREFRSRRLPLVYWTQAEWQALKTRPAAKPTTTGRVLECDEKCQVRLELDLSKKGAIPTETPIVRVVNKQPKIDSTKIAAPTAPSAVPITPPAEAQVLAIGDSVMLGASNYLRRNVSAVDVDAKLGRQVSSALQILQARADANLLTPVVIVHLGNNGTFSARQFDEMMTILKDVPRVIFLTNKVPRKWQGPNNTALIQGVQRYPNTVLVDWNTISMSHPEWFWADGIHLRPEGAQVYTALIADVVGQAIE